MPLRLVTGPANSAKAGEVLGAFRARLREEPLLVVPAFPDLEHAQREMAARGAVFGAQVVLFERLFAEIARRSGYSARRASRLQRELLVEEAVRRAGLRVLARSAGQPGFVRAATRFVTEIGSAGVEPGAFAGALAAWRPGFRYAEEVGAIFSGYRERLDAAGLVDAELFAWRALDALRREPHRFGRTPVFFYGFDDFTALELDAIETLAVRADTDVVVSLPYERGRVAFKAVASVFERLAALAAEHIELPPSDEHYADRSRAPLAHLERELFTGEPGARVDAGEAVRRLQAGGRRAEVELAARNVLELLRSGTAPGDVAVVFRDPEDYGSLVEQVFEAYGIPYSIDRRVPLGHTSLGRGLLALARAATPDGTAEDLLAYLRTPGLLDQGHLADELEARVRQAGARGAQAARELWTRWELDELDALANAKGTAEWLEALERRLVGLFTRPYRRTARILGPDEVADARVYKQALAAIAEMRRLAEQGGLAALDPLTVLERLEVRLGEAEQPDRVQVTAPEAIRARRFEAVFACGLQEGEFPRRIGTEPFLSDDERREINAASGLRLPVRADQLDRERYLFYVTASRAERLLVLSARTSDEEGNPELPSFFLEDVKDVLEGLEKAHAERTLSDVTWEPDKAPTAVEWRRAAARLGPRREPAMPDGLRDPQTIDELAGEWTFSASALEAFADCPVKWLVDRRLRPTALEPDAEQLVRGSYAHDVLKLTFERLHERTGTRRVTGETLKTAEWLLMDAIAECGTKHRISPKQTRARTALRRLEFDLLRLLRAEAESDSAFEPADLEREFETELEGVKIVGRIDRVDRAGDWVLVRDYKTGRNGYPVARWDKDNRLQVAVYMLALKALDPDVKLAGGLYQPLAGRERPRPRGALTEDARTLLGESENWVSTDFVDADGLERALEDARRTVAEIVGRLRRGEIRPCPETCLWSGGHGCTHPSICRVDA